MGGIKEPLWSFAQLAKLRLSGQRFPDVAPTDGEHTRVFIGPTNSAGQAYRWARALEAVAPDVRVTSMAFAREGNPFGYPSDQEVPGAYAAHSSSWQASQFDALVTYRAALIESGQPPFSRYRGLDTVQQIEQLARAGLRCALVFHGSDIRSPDPHMARERASYFSVDHAFASRMREVTSRIHQVVADTGLPVFVSTPDLLTEIEGARWLPVVVDVKSWQTTVHPLQDGGVPRVVHVPSNSFIKGTELIDDTLQRMHDEGIIDYQRVSGVPHAEMPERYRGADIVIDQFRAGIYGVAACEALAAGRIVLSHVADHVRTTVQKLTGFSLPIIETDPEHLEQMLLTIISDSSMALDMALQGPAFVRAVHDGTYSGQILRAWLEEEA